MLSFHVTYGVTKCGRRLAHTYVCMEAMVDISFFSHHDSCPPSPPSSPSPLLHTYRESTSRVLHQYSAVIFNSISFHTRTCGTTHKWSYAIHCRVSHVLSCCTRTHSVHNNLHVRMCISWWCILFLLTHLSIDCVCGVVVVVVCSCVSFTIGHLFPHTKSSCSAPSSLGSWMSRLTDGTMLSPQKMTCSSSSMHVQHLNATTDHTGTPQQHFMHILIPSVFPKHVNGAISHSWHCWQSCIVYVVPPMHVWFSF